MKNPKLCIVVGTRPEIIKMAPVIRACQKQDVPFFLVHTGQHYSYGMDEIFLKELELPIAKHRLEIGSGSHAQQTGAILLGIEQILSAESPDTVLIQGDTNTVLAAALAAAKTPIKIAHIEAGLRSYDRTMPEEINRVLADHVSHYLFAPTDNAKQNLLKEGISEDKVFVTGNTIVDSVIQNARLALEKSSILHTLNLQAKDYFLLTSHRAENVDNRKNLYGLILGIRRVTEYYDIPIVWPIHPRTQKNIKLFTLESEVQKIPGLRIIQPVGFWDFLTLMSHSELVLTDSGGMQEEACILQIPCVTLRENTERPETLDVGSNILAGTDPDTIFSATQQMLESKRIWTHPFGDGKTGEYIINILTQSTQDAHEVASQHLQMNPVQI